MDIFISLLVTASAFGAGPFIFAKTLKGTISKSSLMTFCVAYTAIVEAMDIFVVEIFDVPINLTPAFIWGFLYYWIAKKYLTSRGLLGKPYANPTAPTHNVSVYAKGTKNEPSSLLALEDLQRETEAAEKIRPVAQNAAGKTISMRGIILLSTGIVVAFVGCAIVSMAFMQTRSQLNQYQAQISTLNEQLKEENDAYALVEDYARRSGMTVPDYIAYAKQMGETSGN